MTQSNVYWVNKVKIGEIINEGWFTKKAPLLPVQQKIKPDITEYSLPTWIELLPPGYQKSFFTAMEKFKKENGDQFNLIMPMFEKDMKKHVRPYQLGKQASSNRDITFDNFHNYNPYYKDAMQYDISDDNIDDVEDFDVLNDDPALDSAVAAGDWFSGFRDGRKRYK